MSRPKIRIRRVKIKIGRDGNDEGVCSWCKTVTDALKKTCIGQLCIWKNELTRHMFSKSFRDGLIEEVIAIKAYPQLGIEEGEILIGNRGFVSPTLLPKKGRYTPKKQVKYVSVRRTSLNRVNRNFKKYRLKILQMQKEASQK